jgi:hypothetical protein
MLTKLQMKLISLSVFFSFFVGVLIPYSLKQALLILLGRFKLPFIQKVVPLLGFLWCSTGMFGKK